MLNRLHHEKYIVPKGNTILVILLILLISCSNTTTKQNIQANKKLLSLTDTLAFFQKKFYTQDDGCKGENCSYVSLDYPFYLNEPRLNDTLKSEIISFLDINDSTAFTKSIDTLFNEVMAVSDNPIDSTSVSSPTTMSLRIERMNENSDIISLQLIHDSSGGAHPNEEIHFINWDKKHDRNITLDDIMTNDYENGLNKIAEKIFRSDAGLSSTDSLKAYNFENGEFMLNDNFAITDTSLSFFYNTYEIQGYMQGTTTIDISFKDIKNLLDKKSVIYKYIK